MKALDIDALVDGVTRCDRVILARAITLVESQRAEDCDLAEALLMRLMNLASPPKAPIIGFSGMPGVGKSSLIETLGQRLLAMGKRLAVLAVDPTSPITGGSILGDKTRMEMLSRNANCFIRPSPSGLHKGGISRRTRDAASLCEAAGFDYVFIESVGVGQAEYNLASVCDYFIVLQLPGSGDDLQGIKKGILELADLIVINKADGATESLANLAQIEHQRALQLLGQEHVPVVLCSAHTGRGIDELLQMITAKTDPSTPAFHDRRQHQRLADLENELLALLKDRIHRDVLTSEQHRLSIDAIKAGTLPSRVGARRIFSGLVC
jgi:LAO/AO transport system kinase